MSQAIKRMILELEKRFDEHTNIQIIRYRKTVLLSIVTEKKNYTFPRRLSLSSLDSLLLLLYFGKLLCHFAT